MKYLVGLLFIFILFATCENDQINASKQNKRNHRSGLSESRLEQAVASQVPTSMVRNIRQAKNGDILIASYLGVYRYDGRSFTNITSTIAWPTFWDVLEDSRGNVWLASQDSGVYFQPAGQTGFERFISEDGTAISSALHIYEDRTGNIWFGANRYDGESFRTFTTKDGFPSNNIRLLLEDGTGKLWFGAQGEDMFVYDARTNGEIGQGRPFSVLKDKEGNPFSNVWSVIEDKEGNIWFGADGLWRYDGITFTKMSERGVYAIIEDKVGNIWTTGEVNPRIWALTRYDTNSLHDMAAAATEITSGSPALLGLLEADDGSIWFGGLGSHSGVYRYDGKTVTDFKIKERLD